MSGSFTYASFSPTSTRPGGWGIGHRTGDVPDMFTAEIIPLVPTRISGDSALPTFPNRIELARRVRRFAWIPAPWDPLETGVFLASAAAGQDSSGRTGNVFTGAFITDSGALPTVDAAPLMYSPSVPAPYGKNKVDAAVVPAFGDLERGAVLTDEVVDRFLSPDISDGPGETAFPPELSTVGDHRGPVPRTGILEFLRSRICDGGQVVLVTDPSEGPLWVAALSRCVPRSLPGDRTFTWSTYERASGVSAVLALGTSFCLVAAEDRDQLQPGAGVTVVDSGSPLPSSPAAAASPSDPPATAPDPGRNLSQTPESRNWTSASWERRPTDPFPAAAPTSPESGFSDRAVPGSGAPVNPFPPAHPPHPAPAQAGYPADTGTVATPPESDSPWGTGNRNPVDQRDSTCALLRSVLQLSPKDEEFIRTATLDEWDAEINNIDDRGRTPPRQAPKKAEYYLFLDPADELGRLARVRVLSLLSNGDSFIPARLPEWTFDRVPVPEREGLVAEAAAFFRSSRTPEMVPTGPVTFQNLTSPLLRHLAEEVRRRNVDAHDRHYRGYDR